MQADKNTSIFLKDKTRLGDFVKIQGGYAFQSALFRKRGIPIIRISNIYGSTIDLKNSAVYYDDTKVIGDDFIAKKDDLLIAMSGATTGKCGVYPYQKCAYVNQRVGKFTLCKGDKAIYKYITYWTQSNDFERQLSRFLVAGAQPNVSPKNIEDMELFLPDITEQQNVIAVLDAISANITFLQHLISKQENIKKSTINLLLGQPGNIQLPLSKIASISKGEQLSKDNMDSEGQYIVMNGGVSPSGRTHNYNTSKNTIIISEGGNSCGFVSFIKENFWCGGHCYALSDLSVDIEYLYQILKQQEPQIMGLRIGSGLPNIQKNRLGSFMLSITQDVSKQKAIAQKLGAIDEHISNLKLQLKKQQDLKQGLMQYFFGD